MILLLPFLGFSQGEWDNWYFGVNAAMKFINGTPVALPPSPMGISVSQMSSSVSDSAGNLLFYSNGYRVWSYNHNWMSNGNGLLGGVNATRQPVFAVPVVGNKNQYYLFTVGRFESTGPLTGLHYSIIDMTLNGGFGAIVPGFKNIPLPTGDSAVNHLTAIRHQNNKDVWVVVFRHGYIRQYLAYLITESGISNPVVSNSSLSPVFYQKGSLRISQDGQNLVCSDSIAEMCYFNPATGAITRRFTFLPRYMGLLAPADGMEFSVDSRYLYTIKTDGNLTTNTPLWQFDMEQSDSANFMQSGVLIGTMSAGSIQMGPDGRIYLGNPKFPIDSLNRINDPSSPGTNCNYELNAVYLGGTNCNGSLPQFLQRYKAYIHSSGQCQGHPVIFSGDIWPPADTTLWNFGDPASGSGNVSTLTTPSHLYANPGTYTVTLYVRHNDNRTDTTHKAITILPSPSPVITGPATAAIGQTTTYTTQAGMTGYTWSVSSGGTITGGGTSTDNTVSITWNTVGIHHVFVNYTNSSGCSAASPAVIQVTVGSGPPALYEFWFAAPAITHQTISPSTLNWTDLNKPIRIYLMTADGPATVMIDQPANPSFVPIIKTVNNDSAREVDLTPFIESVETKPANSILNTGLHITSDKKINVIYEIQSPYNAATYTLGGKEALGYEFIIPAQSHLPNFPNCDPPARNVFDIVATEDSTVVHILPKQPIIGHPPADTFAIILNRGQTWSGRAASGDSSKHLGGSFVFADKPVAITVTDDALFVSGSDESTFDIAGDQLMPRDLCGTEFIPVAFLDAFKPKLWIYAFENDTYVSMIDTSYTLHDTINRGEWTEFLLDIDPNLPISTGYAGYLHSNKPVLVYELTGRSVRISASGNASDQYAASVLPPITCTGSKRVCLSRTPPFGAAFSVNNLYWTIVTKNGNQGNIQNNRGFPTANGGFRTVPGTNGEYIFGISSIGGTGALEYMNIIFSSSGDRFQFSSGSSTDNFFTNNYSYSKYSYFSEYSKLFLGPDRSICPGDSLFLDAGYGRDSYLWSTGETTETIWVKTAGTYWVSTTEPDCQLSDTIVISYYPLTPVNLGPNRSICQGDSTMLNAGPGRPWYLWSTGATTQSIWAKNSGNYWVKTSGGHCDVFDTVAVTTTPPPLITTNPLAKTICTGENTNIALSSTVTNTIFHWTAILTSGNITGFNADSGLVINQILIDNLPTPGSVKYTVTPKVGSCSGTPVDFTVTVNPGDSAKVSITGSDNNICSGTPVTFTAVPINPGTTPVYQWKVNGSNAGGNSSVFTYNPVNGDQVKCILTSSTTVCISNNPASSNVISMVVNPLLPVSVSVSASANNVCAGTAVTFTAAAVNGGLTPVYQWNVNGIPAGTNSQVYTYTPLNNDAITCTLTSSEACITGNPATSSPVIMTVNSLLPVGISISASSNPFCLGTSVTLTATPVNGGPLVGYQWKVNGTNAGTNNPTYTYNPVSGDVVTCLMNSSLQCVSGNPATSNAIILTGIPGLPASVSITANPNPFCPGSSVTFTATPGNGGATPSYQWKVNGVNAGTNSPSFTYNPLNNDSVRCVMTSTLSCVSANPATSNKIILNGTLAPVITFTSCFDTVTTVNAKPIKLKGGIPLNGVYSGPGVSAGIFDPAVAGIGTKSITYTYTNVFLCSASKTRTITVQAVAPFTCSNTLTDIRDGKTYPSVQIGTQCWMAANLNRGIQTSSSQVQFDNCTDEKYCFGNDAAKCSKYGGLYQWDEMMRYDDVPAGQGICPPGWHVPTENDWTVLCNYYNGFGFAGKPLQDTFISGFRALTGGVFYLNSSWSFEDFAVLFWTSTSWGSYKALSHGMNTINFSVSLYPSSRANAFPVRCLLD